MIRTFEYDDYPRDGRRALRLVDRFKAEFPNFKATFFCIPEEMNAAAWRAIRKRQEWLHAAPHGFMHDKRECREAAHYEPKLGVLDQMAGDARWAKIFKAPWYGYNAGFLRELTDRGFSFCAKTLARLGEIPMPADHRMWNITDAQCAARHRFPHPTRSERNDGLMPKWEGYHVDAHPIYTSERARLKAQRTEINSHNVCKWTAFWEPTDEWEFVENLTRPALLKLNLGCGPHVWDGWACLDPRTELDPRIIDWDFSRQIPFGDNKADIILTSHVFNYVAEDKYEEAVLECWRVLRPDGVLRMQEDRTDMGWIWKMPGAKRTRGTGTIRSLPTREKIIAALQRVGFEIHAAEPGETLSPHKDVLKGDTRRRRYKCDHKFYVEAIKRVSGRFDIARPRWHDVRCTKAGRYRMPYDES